MGKSMGLSDELHSYLMQVGTREDPILEQLRIETSRMERATMQISPDQGALMQILVQLMGAKRCIEVGTFTGYSSLAVASVLPEDGELIACDVSEEWTSIARRYWDQAGVSHKIALKLAPAVDTLDKLLNDEQSGTFDFAFIEADKTSYEAYYERCLKLVRSGGLIVVDNVLWSGAVVDETDQSGDTVALRDFNRARSEDTRIHLSMVPIADGLTLAIKR